MYALVRKTKLAATGAADEAARRVREGAVPILRDQPGFRLHLGFVSEASEAVGVSLFEDRTAAQAALGRLRAWAAAAMTDLTRGEPEVRGGEVVHRRAPASRLAAWTCATRMSGPASIASPTAPTVCTWQISLAPASFRGGATGRGSPKHSITAAGWRWARQSGPPQSLAINPHPDVWCSLTDDQC